MATKNKEWFKEFSAKYGVQFQILTGNDVTIHVAVIGGTEYNGLAQLKKSQVEQLFKNISMGKADTMENTVSVGKNTIYLNGTKYNIIDVVKGVQVNSLLDILDGAKRSHAYYGIGEWLENWNNRLSYVKTIEKDETGILEKMLLIEGYLRTGKRRFQLIELYNILSDIENEWAQLEGV